MKIRENFSLANLNTFGLTVKARYYCTLHKLSGLKTVLAWQAEHPELPVMWLGGGSNVLFLEDYAGLVVQVKLQQREVLGKDADYVYIRAGAGENWHDFVCWTIEQGYAGLENLSLIPGTVGAAPMQNIGAYGVELKERFYELQALDWRTAELREFSLEQCQFAYRDSYFKSVEADRWLITSVVFRLPLKPEWHVDYAGIRENVIAPFSAKAISDAVIRLRQSKLPDPKKMGNAGSFFKNPLIPLAQWQALKAVHPHLPGWPQDDAWVKTSAAWLIDQCGWKGKRQGEAGVYEQHALVLVNHGQATGKDIWQLAQAIIATVAERFQIQLEPEPRIIPSITD